MSFMTLFSCLIKYYHIMSINIVPPRRQWMDYRCRLVRKFIHCFGAWRPRGKMDLSYSFRPLRLDFFQSALLLSMLTHLFLSSSLSLSYFILAVPIRRCLGKHSCMSSSFPIVILNDTWFFPTVQQVLTGEGGLGSCCIVSEELLEIHQGVQKSFGR